MADSYIAVFEAKYQYQFWRPTMAIRGADADDNDKTTADPNWFAAGQPHAAFSRISVRPLSGMRECSDHPRERIWP
jgi:hypothetical protein